MLFGAANWKSSKFCLKQKTAILRLTQVHHCDCLSATNQL